MREPQDVIIAPVVTEKTSAQMEGSGIYTFIVAKNANKIEIGAAVEHLWDVKVMDVRTLRYYGKTRRGLMSQMNRNNPRGKRASFKKAVVQLAEGDHIELYEVG